MNTSIHKGSKTYIGHIEENPVCFFAVLHFPHPIAKNIKRGHRLVVLPDYQGLGIGHLFSSQVAQHYKDEGFRFRITSSTKALYYQRAKDKRWVIDRKSRKQPHRGIGDNGSAKRVTYSYEFIG